MSTTCTAPDNSTTVLSEVVVMPSRKSSTHLRSTVQEHTCHSSKKVFSRIAVGGTGTVLPDNGNDKNRRKTGFFSTLIRSGTSLE